MGNTVVGGNGGDFVPHHFARNGVDGGFAHLQHQAGPRDLAHAFPGAKHHAAAVLPQTHGGADFRAVGDVGIVPGILDNSHRGMDAFGVLALFFGSNGEGDALAARQSDGDGVGEVATQKRLEGCHSGCCGACPGGITRAQVILWPFPHRCQSSRPTTGPKATV